MSNGTRTSNTYLSDTQNPSGSFSRQTDSLFQIEQLPVGPSSVSRSVIQIRTGVRVRKVRANKVLCGRKTLGRVVRFLASRRLFGHDRDTLSHHQSGSRVPLRRLGIIISGWENT